MRAIVCSDPGHLRLEERSKPGDAPSGWVTIDIQRVGICGTDFHIFEGKHPYLAYPRVMGHELSGRVAFAAEGFSSGDLVIVNPYLSCGTCRACRRGKPNCCTQIEVLGVHRDGGLCDRIAVPAGNLYPAGGLDATAACMVEFLAIGAHAVRRAEVGSADRVLVTGVGPIGLGAAIFARRAGAEVHVRDASAARLETAHDRFGFAATIDADAGDAAVMDATDGDGFDVVFDATGVAAAIESGFAHVAHGGTYALVSVVKDAITFADPAFHKREMKLVGCRNATREDFETVIAGLADGTVAPDQLKTHTAPLDTLPEAFGDWTRARDSVIKAVVEVAP